MAIDKPASPCLGRKPPEITVLAGVNGAGKSSIGGAYLRASGADYFNPDEAARDAIRANPAMGQDEANAYAWQEGKRRLEAAIAAEAAFAFETTLGGDTITRLLLKAAEAGAVIRMWYAGLDSVELHIKRVAARVRNGGHDIPDGLIRKRWIGSRTNLLRLIPHLTTLRLYDNSLERNPSAGAAPKPRLALSIDEKQIVFPPPDRLSSTPQWAKPIVFAAYRHYGLVP